MSELLRTADVCHAMPCQIFFLGGGVGGGLGLGGGAGGGGGGVEAIIRNGNWLSRVISTECREDG